MTRCCIGTAPLVACVVMWACTVDREAENSLVVWTDTVGVVPRVTSRGTPPEWTLHLDARIGSLVDAPSSFGQIRSVVLDRESNIFVADVVARTIVVFDSNGAYVRTIGRKGAGPGEFEQPYSLGWLGDTLLVLDFRNARIGKFSRTGEWLGMWRWQPLTGGEIQLRNGSLSDAYAPVMVGSFDSGTLGYLHITPTGIADTMLMPRAPVEVPSGPVCKYPNDGGIEFFGIPFGPELQVSGGRDGSLLVGWSATYQIAQVDPRADTVRLTRRLRDPIPIDDDEWEERTRRYRNIKTEYPGTVCEPDGQPRPPAKPAFRWFGLDDVGQLWVEVYSDDGFRFEVFDSSGALIGSMPAPHRDSRITPYVGQDRVVVVTRDTLDVHYVEVYSLLERSG